MSIQYNDSAIRRFYATQTFLRTGRSRTRRGSGAGCARSRPLPDEAGHAARRIRRHTAHDGGLWGESYLRTYAVETARREMVGGEPYQTAGAYREVRYQAGDGRTADQFL